MRPRDGRVSARLTAVETNIDSGQQVAAPIHPFGRLGTLLVLAGLVAHAASGAARPAGSSWLDVISSPDSQQVMLKSALKTLLWLPHPTGGFLAGIQASASRSFGAGGLQLGLGAAYYPVHWFGVRVSVGFENTPYLFFRDYRVNGMLLSADINVRWRRLSAALGPNMDYCFAPVADRRFFGWHSEAGLAAFRSRDADVLLAVGHVNRINPRTYDWALGGAGPMKLWQVLLDDNPGAYVRLDVGLKPWRH
jgi:hypothetical protein